MQLQRDSDEDNDNGNNDTQIPDPKSPWKLLLTILWEIDTRNQEKLLKLSCKVIAPRRIYPTV